MLSKCIVVGEQDVAVLKASLARKLKEQGLTQQEISEKLSITQPMVSKYLKGKHAKHPLACAAHELFQQEQSIAFSCLLTPSLLQSPNAYFISTREHLLTAEKSAMVREMAGAIALLKDKDFSALLPKVKINIAFAGEGAKSPEDILASPSGLIFANNHLKTYVEPEFGASHHLSSLLLYTLNMNNKLRCVMNVKYDEKILKKIKQQKLSYAFLNDGYKLSGKQKNFEHAQKPWVLDILIHEGSFGIEPTTYIFGTTPKDVISKCCRLL